MSLTTLIARPMLAGIFVYGGLDALRNPEGKIPRAENVAPQIADSLGIPGETKQLVQLNGGVQVGAGLALGLGWLPRVAALALAGSLVPTTIAGHRFWEEDDPTARARQTLQFLKNLAIGGGLLLAAADTGGRPSVTWRARRAAGRAIDALPIGS